MEQPTRTYRMMLLSPDDSLDAYKMEVARLKRVVNKQREENEWLKGVINTLQKLSSIGQITPTSKQ